MTRKEVQAGNQSIKSFIDNGNEATTKKAEEDFKQVLDQCIRLEEQIGALQNQAARFVLTSNVKWTGQETAHRELALKQQNMNQNMTTRFGNMEAKALFWGIKLLRLHRQYQKLMISLIQSHKQHSSLEARLSHVETYLAAASVPS